jgi:methyl-accepting chemotaxis protein
MFNRFTISTKISLGFGIILLLCLLQGLLAWQQINTIELAWNHFESSTLQKRNTISDGLHGLQEGIHHFKNYILRGGDYAQKFNADMNLIDTTLSTYRQQTELSDAERSQLEQIETGISTYRQALSAAVSLKEAGKSTNEIDKAIQGADKVLDGGFSQLRALNDTSSQQASKQIGLSLSQASVWIISLCVIMVLISFLAAWLIIRSVILPLRVAVIAANKMSKGELSFQLNSESQDEIGQLINALQQMQSSVQLLISDANQLVDSATAGQLAARADTQQHQGDFKRVMHGINDLLDAVIGPLNVAAKYIADIARGDIPAKITQVYHGDFNQIKNNLNTCIDAINTLITDANHLAELASQGQLDVRAELDKHQGDFRKIVQGVNNTLDTLIDPINEVVRVLAAMARGDLTETINAHYHGTLENLRNDTNSTVDHLTSVISRIKTIAQTVQVAAGEIANGNVDLSQRTEQQAASLEETAASMQEFTSTVKQNADNAQRAQQLALNASNIAKHGGVEVDKVVLSMTEINDSSNKIVAIIGVIDDIAFQTNLLALNAAVEAARAGSQGSGFAVVATEVRNLAQRSAKAAKEIKLLIKESVSKTGSATQQAQTASQTLNEVVSSIQTLSLVMSDISSASIAQSAGIEQMNEVIMNMDNVTHRNASLVEAANAATHALDEQTQALNKQLAIFHLLSSAHPAA